MKNNNGFDNSFPDFEQFTSSFNLNNSTTSNSFNFSDGSDFNNNNSSDNNPCGNIDLGTILKIKKIVENMNNTKNNPRANLLLSLKPYLKPSRKEKVDQYIQLFSMGELIENLKPTGGEKSK